MSPQYRFLLGAADYLAYRLCGEASMVTVTDPTTASTTGLTKGPAHRHYDHELLNRANLSCFLTHLPNILHQPGAVGTLHEHQAAHLGRPDLHGITVVHAGGDAYSATVGAGCTKPNSGAYVYAGTSGWIGASELSGDDDDDDDGLFRLAHGDDAGWNITAASISSVGSSLQLGCRAMLDCDVSELDGLASNSAIGAGGVVYVPFVNGRRCPRPRDVTQGGLYGLSADNTRSDVARALVEGVVFSFAEAGEQLPSHVWAERVRVVGGVGQCELFVSGIGALLGDAEVCRCEVGLLGSGACAVEALGLTTGSGDDDARVCTGETLTRVSTGEKQKWRRAFGRWQRVVKTMETLWEDE